MTAVAPVFAGSTFVVFSKPVPCEVTPELAFPYRRHRAHRHSKGPNELPGEIVIPHGHEEGASVLCPLHGKHGLTRNRINYMGNQKLANLV